MKFEHVLQIYWSKGFLTNGKLQSFNTSFKNLFNEPGGASKSTQLKLIQRFELYSLIRRPNQPISSISDTLPESLNLLFSKITNINNSVSDLTKYSLLRLYLTKTTRGRSHALGKPSRGQRTWSNAWSAYHTNNITRSFINAYQKMKQKNFKEEKINYRIVKKKSLRTTRKETVSKVIVKINNWF